MEIPESDQTAISPLASNILAYLRAHASARDSLEGIAEWWLMENDILRKTADVKNALKELVSMGLVEEVEAGFSLQYRMHRTLPDQLS